MPLSFLVALGLLAPPAHAEGSQPPNPDPAILVRQLGDESFLVRERAQTELLKLGASAEAALRKGLTDTDPQVRDVSRQVLDRLLEATRAVRLKAFLEDKEDRLQPPLSGWKRFAAVAGNGPVERKRFLDLYRAAETTLDEVERDPKNAGKPLDKRITQARQQLLVPSSEADVLRELTTLMLLATDPRVPLDAAASSRICGVLAVVAERAAVLKAFQADPVSRKLTRTFLVERHDPAARVAALTAAIGLDLTETADWALQLALGKDNPAPVRGWAVILTGKVGGKERLAQLEPLLEDHTIVGSSKLGTTTLNAELADVILAVLIRASGKKEADFGFPYLQAIPGLKTLPAPERLGFVDAPSRQAALKKWRDSRKK